MADDARLLRLAATILDGQAADLDWSELEQQAEDEDERAVLRRLQLLARVTLVHSLEHSSQPLQQPPASAAPTPGPAERQPAAVQAHSYGSAGGLHRWGPLEIRTLIGSGASSQVYRAWDSSLDREVALKLLNPGAGFKAASDALALEEGKALARIRHPNVVTVYGAEVHDGQVGLWMELIEGRTLEALVRDMGPLGAREAIVIGLAVCRALTAVHSAGLLHRDVKARNVMREQRGRIVLMDFGAASQSPEPSDRERRTITGTPLYMAPELLRGEPATSQSDLYSLGVLLFHLVTASYPIEAGNLRDVQAAHSRREAKLLRQVRADLPEPFVRVVEKATAHSPRERYESAAHMEHALTAALGIPTPPPVYPPPREPRPTKWPRVLFLVGLLAALVGIALWIWGLVRN
jgi:serine/threonine-protein kinase